MMNTWQQRKRAKERQQQLRQNMRYQQNLREVDRSERSLEKLAQQYIAQAMEAERTGNHALAVRLAAEAAKLRKHQTVTGSMKSSLEIAHAVQSTNQAMSDILVSSREAAGSLMPGATAPDVFAMQEDLCSMQEQVQTYMDQSDMLFDDYQSGGDPAANEEGERYLKALMSSTRKEKQLKLLQDTNSRLEKLQRNRPTENEGSK